MEAVNFKTTQRMLTGPVKEGDVVYRAVRTCGNKGDKIKFLSRYMKTYEAALDWADFCRSCEESKTIRKNSTYFVIAHIYHAEHNGEHLTEFYETFEGET